MRKNAVKEKLKNGGTAYGAFVAYREPRIIEFMGRLGWDFFILDGEHGTLDQKDFEAMSRAADLVGTTTIARVPGQAPHFILRALDAGVQGVQVPWVNSGAEALAVAQAAKYPPDGIRGLAPARGTEFWMTAPVPEVIQHANDETLVVVQIEGREAVEKAEEIAAVDGVDVIFIGPADLSSSLGVPQQLDHPDLLKAIDRVIDVVSQTDKVLGIYAGSKAKADHWADRGARYVTASVDEMLIYGTGKYFKG